MPIQTNMQSAATIIRRKAAVVLANHGLTLCTVATLVEYSISSVNRSLQRMNDTGHVFDRIRSGRQRDISIPVNRSSLNR